MISTVLQYQQQKMKQNKKQKTNHIVRFPLKPTRAGLFGNYHQCFWVTRHVGVMSLLIYGALIIHQHTFLQVIWAVATTDWLGLGMQINYKWSAWCPFEKHSPFFRHLSRITEVNV